MEDIGRRDELEDRHFLVQGFRGKAGSMLGGVFDGHFSDAVSRLAASKVAGLVEARLAKNQQPDVALGGALKDADGLVEETKAGSTAVVFLLRAGEVAAANLGDSVLILVTETGQQVLTEEHRLSNPKEKSRIEALGTKTDGTYVLLPDGGGVMCTRALGDHRFRKVGVIAEPFTMRARVGMDARWLIAGCDGLTDELSSADIAGMARGCASAREICEKLRDEALVARSGTDNLTILAIDLRT